MAVDDPSLEDFHPESPGCPLLVGKMVPFDPLRKVEGLAKKSFQGTFCVSVRHLNTHPANQGPCCGIRSKVHSLVLRTVHCPAVEFMCGNQQRNSVTAGVNLKKHQQRNNSTMQSQTRICSPLSMCSQGEHLLIYERADSVRVKHAYGGANKRMHMASMKHESL